MSFGARALIRLGAISHNLDVIKSHAPGARVMAVVKSNAYGHGLPEVAAALAEADCLAVARLHEAGVLRNAGIATPIALLGGAVAAEDLRDALDLDLQLAVHNTAQIEWLENFDGGRFTVWLKIDTGMNRLGFPPAQAARQTARLGACPAVGEIRLMTHFANAEGTGDAMTPAQIQRFGDVIRDFRGDVSIANSPGVLGWQAPLSEFAAQSGHDRWWIRPGLALYGVSPFAAQQGADLGLLPVMDFVSSLLAVKPLRKGEPVGYGGTWKAACDTVLGIVAAGYGDGYSRFVPSGTPVLVNGRRVPVAGRVSMDLTAVDLGPGAQDSVGDPVLLWGGKLPVEEIAASAGTIPYQLLCGVTHREPPVYI